VKQYQRLFEMENIELTFADEALGAVARRAIERKTGARGLRSILESILLETMFDLPGLEGVEEVVISREVVEGPLARSTSTPIVPTAPSKAAPAPDRGPSGRMSIQNRRLPSPSAAMLAQASQILSRNWRAFSSDLTPHGR